VVVKGGEWSKILAELAASHDINYEGASGAVNLDQFGDPLSGYGIWGIDTSNKIKTVAFFNEAAVIAMVGTASVSAAMQDLRMASSPSTAPSRSKED
jgi:hypothetical protein